MADLSDVLTVLASTVTATLYPNGTSQPSIVGSNVVIYPGWPSSDGLDADLAVGKVNVTVFPKAEERNTTRYSEKAHVMRAPAPTLTLTIGTYSPGAISLEGGAGNIELEGGGYLDLEAAQSVTVGGTVSTPQNVMLKVNGNDYVYGVQKTDTLQSIASALAALVAADIAGTKAVGLQVVIGSGCRLQAARVGGFGLVAKETRRQEHLIAITVWAPTPELRDQVAGAIDEVLSDVRFLTMPDGFGARLIYKNTLMVDALQKAALYRRDLNYSVEYATTKSWEAAAVIAPKIGISNGSTQETTINI